MTQLDLQQFMEDLAPEARNDVVVHGCFEYLKRGYDPREVLVELVRTLVKQKDASNAALMRMRLNESPRRITASGKVVRTVEATKQMELPHPPETDL